MVESVINRMKEMEANQESEVFTLSSTHLVQVYLDNITFLNPRKISHLGPHFSSHKEFKFYGTEDKNLKTKLWFQYIA